MKIDKNPPIDQYIANSPVINIDQIKLIDLYYE